MLESQVFSRVRPKQIKIVEQYDYNATIATNSNIQPVNTPIGKIEIVVPYDGEIYFNLQALADIEEQVGDVWSQTKQCNARIGYLAFSQANRTNIEEKAKLNLQNGVLPLDVPINGNEFKSKEHLIDTRNACLITQEYTPRFPQTIPLKIEVNVFDEDALQSLQVSMLEGQFEEENDIESRASLIERQEGFDRRIFFQFQVYLALPMQVGKDPSSAPPILTRMAIEWPVAISNRAIDLLVPYGIQKRKGSNENELLVELKPATYIPERSVIQWGNMPLGVPQAKSPGTGLYWYSTPPMTFSVDQPGELYHKNVLKGEIEIQLSQLLSGLQLHHFNATGTKGETSIIQESLLHTNIEIDLSDHFDQKMFTPYQHLQFEGVILDSMRVTDIKTLLENFGFSRPTSKELKSDRPNTRRFIITATQKKELEELVLWMLVVGTRSQTTRQREVPGGQTFTTDVETGHTVIYMRGKLRGNSAELITVMNNIQRKLKQQFRHVSTID